jgi:signal transduction histidine kinase
MGDQKSLSLLLTRSAWIKWGFVLGLMIYYILIFKPIITTFGPAGSPLIALPVIAAGWYFGIWGGLITSVLAVPLNYLLFASMGYSQGDWFTGYTIPGNLVLILVGFIAGVLRSWVERQTNTEIALRSRERYLALMNIMTQSILSAKTPEDMYYYLASHLTNLFEADFAFIAQWDSIRNQTALMTTTLPLEKPLADIPLEPGEFTMIESVMQTGHALPIEDLLNSKYAANSSLFQQSSKQTYSELAIPLIAGEYKFGAVVVAWNSPHRFTVEEITRAEQAGKNVTLALWSIQQKDEIQKRLREANTLANIERALSETERVDLETVLQFIVDSTKELITNAEQAVIHLLDDEQQLLIPKAVAGSYIPSEGKFYMRLGEGAAGRAIARKEVINIQDVSSDPRFLRAESVPSYRSLLVAPIQSSGQPIGTISVQSNQTYAFSTGDMELLSTLSTQAAIAIENARLLETTRQSLKEINALYRINQGLVASIDSAQIMKDVVDLLQKNFGYYHVQIYMNESQSGDLVLREATGEIGSRLKQDGYRLSAGTGIVGHVAETSKPFMTNDVDRVVFFYRNPLLPDTRAELAVPIKIENKVVGILDIQHQSSAQLNEHHLQLISAVADQLAVALQKADLYSDLQHSLNQEKAMRTQLVQSEKLAVMGRLLASVSHELNNPLQAIQNALFLLKEEEGISSQGQQDLEIVLSESERMAALIERLRTTYRPHQLQDFRSVQMNSIIEDVYALIATHLRHNEISFEFYPDPQLPVIPGLPDELREVMLNLAINAVEAMTRGGRLSISTQYLPESCEILLVVADNGPGIEPSILPNIFDAFVTNKATGTGLGLTISYEIIQKHRGRIKAENNSQGGAIFSIWLPERLVISNENEEPYLNH